MDIVNRSPDEVKERMFETRDNSSGTDLSGKEKIADASPQAQSKEIQHNKETELPKVEDAEKEETNSEENARNQTIGIP